MDLFSGLIPLRMLDVTFTLATLYLIKELITRSSKTRGTSYKLPPGPEPIPLIGNFFDLPKELEWVHWAKYKDIYGPVSSVTVFGQTLIILNDLGVAQDLLETRSSIYSNRPVLTFSGNLCGWDRTSALLQYDDECKTHRRLMHGLMGTPKLMMNYSDLISKQMQAFLNRVLRKPEELSDHINIFVGAVTLSMVYGYEVSTSPLDGSNDPLVKSAREVAAEFADSSIPGKWFVDTMPLLRYIPSWFPGASFKAIGEKYKNNLHDLMQLPVTFVQNEMKNGTASRSYTADLLEKDSSNPDPWLESIIKHSAISLYLAGTDTTISIINTFFLVMMLNPSIQRKAQAEIDKVIGSSRLPGAEDRPHLPYLNALVKETLRWNPPIPLGIPHASSQDDVYRGYIFPKGSVVIPNVWLFTRDPENYAKPFEFRPERFLRCDFPNGKPEPDPHDIIFGFGRRECPGKLVADMELFLAFACSLAVFDIKRPVDEHDRPIEDKYEFGTTGLLSHPKKFKCAVVPRSKAAEELITTMEADLLQDSGHAEKLLDLQTKL